MENQKCSTCSKKDSCGVAGMLDWLGDDINSSGIESQRLDFTKTAAYLASHLLSSTQVLTEVMKDPESYYRLFIMLISYGYFRGRTYIDNVAEPFRRE